MKIALFYDRQPGVAGEYFHRALQGLGHTIDQFNLAEAERCPRSSYEVFLRIDHGDYARELPSRLRPAVFYVIDAHLARSWKRIRSQAKRYDLLFCAQRRAAARLPRAFWVPLGCDPELHGTRTVKKQYDLAFVGNDGGVPRKLYLQELRERYPNSFIGQAPYTRMAEIYSQAKIGFHYIECTSPLKDHVSMRVFEILASGTMLLANALEAGAFEAIGLRDKNELVSFRTPAELFERIEFYLQHDEARERVAEAGHACVLASHTYRHRAEHMIRTIHEKLGV